MLKKKKKRGKEELKQLPTLSNFLVRRGSWRWWWVGRVLTYLCGIILLFAFPPLSLSKESKRKINYSTYIYLSITHVLLSLAYG